MEEKKKHKGIFLSANGMNKHTCKNWCSFIFQDFFHSVEINNQNRCFDIFLKSEVTDFDGKVFKLQSNKKVIPLEKIFNDIEIGDRSKEILQKRIEDLLEQKDKFDLSYFKEFWGREFNIEILEKKKVK